MKIDAVRIKLFGKLANKDFGPFSEGLTVFFGENESGKTTLKEFIRTTLFKTSARTKGVYPQTSSTDSGEVDCTTDDGKSFTVERKGNRTTSSIGKMPEEISGINPDVYRSVYAMDPNDLIDTGIVESGDIKRRFLTVPGGEDMPQISENIDSEMEELLNKSRITWNKGIGETLDMIDKNEASIAKAKTKGLEYGALVEDENRIETELKGLREKQEESVAIKRKIEIHNEKITLVEEHDKLAKEREAMGDADKAPPEGLETYQNLKRELDLARSNKEKKEAELERLKGGTENISPEILKDNEGRIHHLSENIGRHGSSTEKIRGHRLEVESLDARISDMMERNGLDSETVAKAETGRDVIERANNIPITEKNWGPPILVLVFGMISIIAGFAAGVTFLYALGAILVAIGVILILMPTKDGNDDFSAFAESKGYPSHTDRKEILRLSTAIDDIRSMMERRDVSVSNVEEYESIISDLESELNIVATEASIERTSFENDVRRLRALSYSVPGVSEATEALKASARDYESAATKLESYLAPYGSSEEFEKIVKLKTERDGKDKRIKDLKEFLGDSDIKPGTEPPGEPEDFQKEIGELQRSLGSINTKKTAILKDADTENLYNKRSLLQAELESQMRAWGVLSLEKHISNMACDNIYDNMQPLVIRTADRYLDMMTNGRYRMENDPRTSEVSIRGGTKGGGTEVKTKGQWSSGLAGQVSLSLKLAVAKEYSNERLPILLDDVLLVFDSERKKGACQSLSEVAKEMQIILFTCDRETYELMKEVGADTEYMKVI